jgi:DNA-binding transcriptional regulator YiaG
MRLGQVCHTLAKKRRNWERGKRKPGGPALKRLNGIQKYGIEVVAVASSSELMG